MRCVPPWHDGPEGDGERIGVAVFADVHRPATGFIGLNNRLLWPDQTVSFNRNPEGNLEVEAVCLDGTGAVNDAPDGCTAAGLIDPGSYLTRQALFFPIAAVNDGHGNSAG